jgi:hypothetical protein
MKSLCMKNPTDTVRKAEGEKLESITVHPVQQTEAKKNRHMENTFFW